MGLLWFAAGASNEVVETTESAGRADTFSPCRCRAADETVIPAQCLVGWILSALCLLVIVGHIIVDLYRNKKCSVFGTDIGKSFVKLKLFYYF